MSEGQKRDDWPEPPIVVAPRTFSATDGFALVVWLSVVFAISFALLGGCAVEMWLGLAVLLFVALIREAFP